MTRVANDPINGSGNAGAAPDAAPERSAMTSEWVPALQRVRGALLERSHAAEKRASEMLQKLSGAGALVHDLKLKAEEVRRTARERTGEAVARLHGLRSNAARNVAQLAGDRIESLAANLHRVAGRLKTVAVPPPPEAPHAEAGPQVRGATHDADAPPQKPAGVA